jgi:CRP/FNR family transcriptional regulator, cyclic AMP receptor protein
MGAPEVAAWREQLADVLADDDLAALVARGTPRTFSRGQALLHVGQLPDRVLLIREGRVKVETTTPQGRSVVLAVRGPGELVGELSALDEQPRSASLVALEQVDALTFSHHDFRAFLLERPSAALALLGMLSRRLRDADAKRIEYAAAGTLERVAARIVEMCERFGEEGDGAIEISLPLSQEELAGWTGSSVESVGRALQTMRSLAWIETSRRRIRVLKLDALRSAAGG